MKRKYELVLVLPSRLEKDERDALVKKIKKIVTGVGAVVLQEESWGDKEMAYPIKHETIGLYLIWALEIEPPKITEMKRLLNFETDILRYALLQVKK